VFEGVTVYINGSTYPAISDHKLKHVLAENGAKIAVNLTRRDVTHVILGKPCGGGSTADSHASKGVGGGLAARKLQHEITKLRGSPVKYVSVEW
jgi:hypothetical protein